MNEAFLLDDVTLWAIIVAFFGPLVIAFAARPTMRPGVKILIQVAFSAVVAIVTAYLNGVFEGRSLVSILLLVLATSTLAYKGFWKPTGVADKVESTINAGSVDNAVEELPEPDDVNPQDIR